MTVNPLTAANAYKNQLKMMQGAPEPAQEDANKPSFAKMVENAAQDAINTEYKTEGQQLGSLTGKVELSDLVTAVANAELTLNTVVAVRDRVINAYNDIIKMPI